MTIQRAIRFPDDLHDAIEAEARRLGHPHTFSSVIVNAARQAVDPTTVRILMDRDLLDGKPSAGIGRGSPSPSLERFAKPEAKR